jgi:hypothetical protein
MKVEAVGPKGIVERARAERQSDANASEFFEVVIQKSRGEAVDADDDRDVRDASGAKVDHTAADGGRRRRPFT